MVVDRPVAARPSMLTRIEINGFKTFEDFELDVPPLLVIAGANAAGKSNLFDAIRLLSRLAETDLRSAFTALRGEPHELFRRDHVSEYAGQMKLAVDVLLEPTVSDPWGQVQALSHTRFRYELSIERRTDGKGLERLYVVHEAASPLRKSEDTWPVRTSPDPRFIDAHMKYSRRAPLLETIMDSGRPSFKIHQDGVQGRVRPAMAAEATVLSSITTAEFRHLYAIRQELRSWRFLQLDPAALRTPASKQAPDRLESDGGNLAAVLARIQVETASTGDPRGELVEISADLASLIPGVTGISVEEDEHNKRWELSIASRSQSAHSSRVASDGTLRLLALLTALSDPVHGGLICFEEPENGVHPARLRPLIEHLRALVTDPLVGDVDGGLPLIQLLLSTHSPVVVSELRDGEGVFFESTRVVGNNGEAHGPRTRQRQVRPHLQQTLGPEQVGNVVAAGEVNEYLGTASPR